MKKTRIKRLFTGDRPRGPVFRMVSAYVRNIAVPPGDLGPLIATVGAAVIKLERPTKPVETARPSPVAQAPAATGLEVHPSITSDGLRSFEDGRHYRTLRRHLKSRGLDPDAYRTKWGLPPDYPMTCPLYSARRSLIARRTRPCKVSRM